MAPADLRSRRFWGITVRFEQHRGVIETAAGDIRRGRGTAMQTIERVSEATATSKGSKTQRVLDELPVLPNYGRTAEVVGPVINVNTEQMPHPKTIRGELGKAAFNWYRNTVSKDPLTRVTSSSHCADKRNFLTSVMGDSVKGKINDR